MSGRWKQLERDAAKALGGQRVCRNWLAFEKAPDCRVAGFKLVLECKAYERFAHHRHIEAAQDKYCGEGETALLVTREPGKQAYCTVPLDWLGGVLNQLRDLTGEKP